MGSSEVIDCPRAKTWMTPCVARDGGLVVADDGRCVGCNERPTVILADLRERFPAACDTIPADQSEAADVLTDAVARYIDAPA